MKKKRKAFIVDIDGTLFDISWRAQWLNGPENTDWEKFLDPGNIMKDKPIPHVCELVNCIGAHYPIIFITGRNEGIREITKLQLDSVLRLRAYGLYMRPDTTMGQGKDADIKAQIYEDEIEKHFDIIGVFEDKQSVVDMWRSKGLQTYQVAEPPAPDGF